VWFPHTGDDPQRVQQGLVSGIEDQHRDVLRNIEFAIVGMNRAPIARRTMWTCRTPWAPWCAVTTPRTESRIRVCVFRAMPITVPG
jgi:hypothetical protein